MAGGDSSTLYILFTGDDSYVIHWLKCEYFSGAFTSIELAQQAVEDYFNHLRELYRGYAIESGNKEKRRRLRFYPTKWKDEDGILRRGMRIKDWDWVGGFDKDLFYGCEIHPVTLNAWVD